MAKYEIWDKQSDIFTLGPIKDLGGRRHVTAQEYIDTVAPWAANPNVKIVVMGGPINGMVFEAFDTLVQRAKAAGVVITDEMSDTEVLAAIEAFEDNPPETEPDATERTAAALEFLAMMSM